MSFNVQPFCTLRCLSSKEQLRCTDELSEPLYVVRRDKLGKPRRTDRLHFVRFRRRSPRRPLTCHSYDYGAPIREDRTLSSKFSEIRLQANFLHASPDFLVATRFGYGTNFTSNPNIFTTALSAPSGAHFYVIRQNSVTYAINRHRCEL